MWGRGCDGRGAGEYFPELRWLDSGEILGPQKAEQPEELLVLTLEREWTRKKGLGRGKR